MIKPPTIVYTFLRLRANTVCLIALPQPETSSAIPSLDVDGYAGISVPQKTSKELMFKGKSLITSTFYVLSVFVASYFLSQLCNSTANLKDQ